MISRRILAAFAVLCALATPLHAQTGSQKTLAQMNTEISVNLPTTGTKAISALTVRQTLVDLTASVVFLNDTRPFTSPVSSPSYKIGSDIVLTHPLTPNFDNVPGSIITLGACSGQSLAPIHSTQYLTFFGYCAGGAVTTADHITAGGAFALASYVTGPTPAGLTAIGVDSQRALTTGSLNTTYGEHTFTQAMIFTGVTGVGYGAGFNIGGTYNTMFGYSSGQGVVGMTGDYNVGLGPYTLNVISGTASGNLAAGAFAGSSITTGGNNFCAGRLTCSTTLSTGNENIIIGTLRDTPSAGTNSYLDIGGWLYGDAANYIRIKGSSGTKPPTAISGTSGTAGSDDSSLIIVASGSFTLTLPAASSYSGRWLTVKGINAQTVVSASSNVVPLNGPSAGTAILAATAGKWAQLQSDGLNWNIMAGN